LRLDDHAMHDAGADLAAAAQARGNLLQKRVAARDRQRPGSGEDGVKFGVGQAKRRHGGDLA
jgi:hypothetical protein